MATAICSRPYVFGIPRTAPEPPTNLPAGAVVVRWEFRPRDVARVWLRRGHVCSCHLLSSDGTVELKDTLLQGLVVFGEVLPADVNPYLP